MTPPSHESQRTITVPSDLPTVTNNHGLAGSIRESLVMTSKFGSIMIANTRDEIVDHKSNGNDTWHDVDGIVYQYGRYTNRREDEKK